MKAMDYNDLQYAYSQSQKLSEDHILGLIEQSTKAYRTEGRLEYLRAMQLSFAMLMMKLSGTTPDQIHRSAVAAQREEELFEYVKQSKS